MHVIKPRHVAFRRALIDDYALIAAEISNVSWRDECRIGGRGLLTRKGLPKRHAMKFTGVAAV